MILGPYEFGPAPKGGSRLMFRGDFGYVQVLRDAFPPPVRWYGPYEAFDARYDWVLYGHAVDEKSLSLFLEFASTSPFIPTTLNECWVLSMHMGEGGRSSIGELVYNAKTYDGKPGDPDAAEELCRLFVERIRRHPGLGRADGIVGVPANPPKSPHNLPELMAERAARALGIPLTTKLLEKLKPTDIKNLPNEEKLAALQGAYRLRGVVSGKTIVVVDDLIRSGSTLGFLADLLRERSARRILGLAATKTIRD